MREGLLLDTFVALLLGLSRGTLEALETLVNGVPFQSGLISLMISPILVKPTESVTTTHLMVSIVYQGGKVFIRVV